MDRKKLELAAFAVIGLAILAIWAWQSFNPQTPEVNEVILKTPEVKEIKIEEEQPQYKIKASYPEFHDLGDPAREADANNLIKQKVQQSINSFKSASEEAADISSEIKSEIAIDYEVINVNPSIVSIKIRESSYTEGATHPLSLLSSFNYNFKDNREIALADLFIPGSNYLARLSQLSSESLKNQLKEYYIQESIELGTAPTSENFSVFFLTKDNFIIIFNVYQVASYAAGSQAVEVPYDKLAEIINPEGLIKLVRQ